MEIVVSENETDGHAIRALGSLFKLTEVFLSDDNSTEVRRSSSFPKHIRFNFDDDDEEEVVVEDDGKINPSRSFETLDDITLGEDVELNQQMSELGLPLSFQSSKEAAGIPKGKRKGKHKKNPQNQKKIQDEVPVGSSKVSAEDNLPDAVDESINSSSLSFPCQSEPSSCTADFSSFAQSSSIEEKQENTAAAKSTFSSQEQQHVADDVSYGGTSDMSGDVFIFHGLEDTRFVSGSNMMPAADLLTLCASSSVGVVADGGSIDKGLKEIDGKVKKHAGIEGSSSVSGNYDMAHEELCSTITSEQSQASDSAEHSSKVVDCKGMDSSECCGNLGDWGAFWDPFCTRYYFYNVQSQETTWDPPPGMEHFAFCSASNCTSTKMAGMESVGPENTLFESISCETACRGCNEGAVAQMSEAGDLRYAEDSDKMLFSQMHPDSVETIVDDDLKIVSSPPANKKKKKKRRRRIKNKSSLDTDEQMQFQDDVVIEEDYVDISKYWCQRYLLFSKFDHGIQLDGEGWFSVTPETIARHQASRCVGDTVIDCFAGVGGNAIQFAIANKHVTAIDIDPKKIDYARSNANIYGVEDQIDFIRGDVFLLAPKLKADMVFLSPPWGGPDYLKAETYDMNMLKPHDGQYLFGVFREVASRIVMFLPRNVDVNQLAEIALSVDPPWSLEVEKNFLNGKLKAVTAYFSKSIR